MARPRFRRKATAWEWAGQIVLIGIAAALFAGTLLCVSATIGGTITAYEVHHRPLWQARLIGYGIAALPTGACLLASKRCLFDMLIAAAVMLIAFEIGWAVFVHGAVHNRHIRPVATVTRPHTIPA